MALMGMDVAAERLGVSVRQVQRLAKSGDLHRVGANLLDAESVHRLEQQLSGHRRRAWAESTAWAAIALLSDVKVDWLGQPQLSRLKARLRGMSADELVGASRNRADVHHYTAHRAVIPRLAKRLVVSGTSDAIGGLTAATAPGVDGYVSAIALDRVIDEYVLSTDGAGDAHVALRATTIDLDIVRTIVSSSNTLAALDLSTSLDVRERSVGRRVLTERLSEFA